MKTKEELEEVIKDTIKMYKKIIVSSDTPACMACLDELRKHPAIDQYLYDKKRMEDTMRKLASEGLQKYIVIDGDTIINKRTCEVLNPEVDSHAEKINFKPIFIVFMDHKMTCRRIEEIHILNGIGTLGT